jgi:hypothetical protein
MSPQLPTVEEAKRQAKCLREDLRAEGREIAHSRALEIVARQHGFRDWNAFHAAIGIRPPGRWMPGGRITGRYLSRDFEASVLAVDSVRPGWFRLTLEFDEAIDVVKFESFSNFRRRLSLVVGPEGHTRERTSDGKPLLRIDM